MVRPDKEAANQLGRDKEEAWAKYHELMASSVDLKFHQSTVAQPFFVRTSLPQQPAHDLTDYVRQSMQKKNRTLAPRRHDSLVRRNQIEMPLCTDNALRVEACKGVR